MSAFHEDPSVIHINDILSFQIDGIGFVATSSRNEPITESEESITQLRVANIRDYDHLDYTRCSFRIESDALQKSEILFGSVIQLVHVPSEFYLVGTAEVDNGYNNNPKPHNIYLRKELEDDFNIAHKWIIQPRYKLRSEGDVVRVNDHVILRNAQYKHFIITSFLVQNEAYEHLVGLDKSENCACKIGIKIIRIVSSRTDSDSPESTDVSDLDYLRGNDYIRIAHREYSGHVLARLNDENEIMSVVTPFGAVSRKNTAPKDHSVMIVVRPFHMQQPRIQYDFATAFSCLGIWQIILVKPVDETTLQGKIRRGSKVRIRNVVTGQYLAVRPALHADIDFLLHKSKKKAVNAVSFSKDETDEIPGSLPRSPGKLSNSAIELEKNDGLEEKFEPLDYESIRFIDEPAPLKDVKPTFHVKVTLIEAVVPDLKKLEWVGKNNPYLIFSFSTRFKAQTDPVENAISTAKWELISKYQGMFFECSDMNLVTEDLQVNLMNKHSLFRDSNVGHGAVSLESVRSITNAGLVELNIPLFNKRNRKVGIVKLVVKVEIVSGPSTNRDIVATDDKITINPDIILMRSNSAKTDIYVNKLHGDAEISPNEKNFEWIVATTSEPSEYSNFHIHALNKEFSTREHFVRYDDNIYFESALLKHRIQLVSPSQGRHFNKWWEYKEDARLEPKQVNPDYVIDSEVFLLERVAISEVQDTLYAAKALPLARAATVTLQLTPSLDVLYTPMFRHFRQYLHTLALWTLGEVDNDGALLPEQGDYRKQKHTAEVMEKLVDIEYDDDESEENLMEDMGLGFLVHSPSQVFPEDEKQDPTDTTLFQAGSTPKRAQIGRVRSNKVDKSKFKSSSFSPWLGRVVGSDFVGNVNDSTPLQNFTESVVNDIVGSCAATNPIIMRRQVILFDLKIMEQLMHFLNVFFILQRAISFSENADILAEYPGLPVVVQQCTHAVHLFLSAAVHSNERNALKLLSIRGSLLSLISQKILGWNPPLESIVTVAFDSANDSSKENHSITERFKVEDVLVHSITSSDIRQILEQMNEMNQNADSSANNLLSLLNLLCQAGKARKYFQNIIIRYIITCDESITNFSSTSSFGRSGRFPREHNSLLFQTEFQGDEWMVRFQSSFMLPPQENRNEESFKKELLEEGQSLKNLFFNYNRAEIENDILDLEECFLLVEDLGFGGPFLYEEIGQLVGANVWGFLHWWCYRSTFYYPFSSVAHSQISPIQAMKLIGPNIDEVLIMMEFNRRWVDRDSIMRSLHFLSIINSRITGLNLAFSENGSEKFKYHAKQLTKTPSNLGLKSNTIRKMRSSKLKEKIGPQFRDWITFPDALAKSEMKEWFRGSIRLLSAVCENSNALSQRIVSVILPAECILWCLLNEQLSKADKYMFCDLMTNLYIDNLFVFPTRCIPVRREGLYCAIDEDIYNPPVSLGKVFNPLSRVCVEDESFIDGSHLRKQLYEIIKKEASNFVFYSTSQDTMNYNRALLRLFRKLLYQGFFGEQDFDFLDFTEHALQTKTYFFSPKDDGSQLEPSNLKEFEMLVMRKLAEVKEAHHYQDFSAASYSPEINEEKNVAVVANEEITQRAKNKKKFSTIFEDLASFDKIFADVGYAALVHSAISALEEFMEIRQMFRVQKLWNHIGNYTSKYTLLAYGNDLPDLTKVLDDKTLYSVFNELVPEEHDEKAFVDAIFCGVLHTDRHLTEECLQLLDRRLSLYRGIFELMECCNFSGQSSLAIINRCLSVYFTNLYNLILEVLESETQYRLHSIQIIEFFMENIITLLLKTDAEKFSNSLKLINADTIAAGKLKENDAKARFKKDRNKIIFTYMTSREIVTPVGEDDFFLLDLKTIMANTEQSDALQNQYANDMINYPFDNFKWLIDAKENIVHFTEQIVVLLPQFFIQTLTTSSEKDETISFEIQDIDWLELSSSQQVILDKVFTFLSHLWKDKSDFHSNWFPSLTDLLFAVYPVCNGATSFLHIIVQHSSEEKCYVDDKLLNNMTEVLDHYPKALALPIKFRLMFALISSKKQSFVEKGGIILIDQLHDYFMSKFQVLNLIRPIYDTTNYNTLALQILQPIYIFLTSKVFEVKEISESYISGFQVYCSPQFCESILVSKFVHLQVKKMMFVITLRLYSIDDFPLEDFVLKQLRSLRLFLHLLKPEEIIDRNLTGIRLFYFESMVPYLKYRILETNILTNEIISLFIMSELDNQKGKMINKHLANEIMNKISPSFLSSQVLTKQQHHTPLHLHRTNTKESVEESASSYLPAEIITSLMIFVNTLLYRDAILFRQCTLEEKVQLIWVTGAGLLFIQSRPDFIFDRELNQVVDIKLYERVRDCLKELFEGFLLDYLSYQVENYLEQYYSDLLLSEFGAIIKEQFENANQNKKNSFIKGIRKSFRTIRGKHRSTIPVKIKSLKQGLNIRAYYDETFLKRTELFHFLSDVVQESIKFVKRGGMALFSTDPIQQLVVKTKSFARKFNNYTIFDLWLKGNGRFLSHIMLYLGNILTPKTYDYTFVHIISALLSHNIEEIQENSIYSTNFRLSLIQSEQERLHEIQNTLASLGCLEMTIKVFGRSYISNSFEYLWNYTPLMLKVAAELIAWQNKTMQVAAVDLIEGAIAIQKPPERYCLVGLQRLLRRASTDIVGSAALSVTPDQVDEHIMKTLRVLVHFCSFAGALCNGDNSRSQRFLVGLSKTTDNSHLIMDLSQDVCILVNAVIVRFVDMIIYIRNDNFMNRLAPFIYEAKDTTKRRFLAWHDRKNNFPIMMQFIYALSVVFENCISLCTADSVHAVLKALPKAQDLLEFFGVLQLTATAKLASTGHFSLKHVVKWEGGNPVNFYRTLIREMKRIDVIHSDPDFIEFSVTYRKWMDIISKNKFHFTINSYFHQLFGISYELFLYCTRKAENSCLRLILSALEVSPRSDTIEFVSKLSDSMLIQNLDSSFKKLVWTFISNKDVLTSTTVAYVSLIESIGRVNPFVDELLAVWDESYTGFAVTKPKSIYGSVELVDSSGRIRRLFFPIPSFVAQFWSYPEVQKTKEAVVYEVNRDSPEEKIADFLLQMSRITVVMKRQERLSLLLTYPIHAIFGGKSVPGGKYFPKQNNIALFLTFGLNCYYVYYNTHPFILPELSANYIDILTWDTRTTVVMIIQWAHFLLLGTYAFRSVLNSDAADDIDLFEGEGLLMKGLTFILTSPYALFLIVKSALWPLALTAMSFWALYSGSYWLYTPCLLDITFQFEVMNFLFQAIQRNVFRIGATLLLAFLCLYFYSIIAFLYIGKQYSLGGITDCVDPGACFKMHLDYGLSNFPEWVMPGYISPNFGLKIPYAHQVSYLLGTAYNLSYIIIINLVLQALISGLIIDTFSEMRQERESIQNDIDSKCFICSIARDEFEQKGISYQTHIKEEHNMWHYLWFKLYLELKDPLGFSSTENYASRNFRDKQTFVKMIPIKRSLTLEAVTVKDRTEEEKTASDIEELKKMIEKLQHSQYAIRERLEFMQLERNVQP